MKEAMNFIRNLNIKSDESIVVAVSGGPDSMALLDLLIKIRNEAKYNIVCAHVNHNVREESKYELEFVKEYCEDNNVIFESLVVDKWQNDNFHALARKVRYEFFESLLEKYNSKYLFLAHHGDDLIETILMRLTRGSSFAGYHAFLEIESRETYSIIRPLLHLSKQEIEDYDKSNNINYVIDKSNFKDKYTRNRYRKYVLPFLKKEDPNIHKKFIMYSNTLLEYDNYIKKETEKIVNSIYYKNKLNLEKFNKLDYFMKKNTLYYILNNLYNNKQNIITHNHINNIINICKKDKNNSLNLPKDLILIKEYQYLSFKYKNKNTNYKYLLKDYQKIDNHIIRKINKSESNGNNICRINSKNINLPLYIRNKKDGDKIEVLGLNGHKKISDIFVEKKIPISIRNKYPIVVDNKDNIIWVPNLKKSKFNTKNNEFYDIILEYCEKEEN